MKKNNQSQQTSKGKGVMRTKLSSADGNSNVSLADTFCLSNELWFKGKYIDEEDVKQAVKELKKELSNTTRTETANQIIDKIFGERLI